VNSAGERTLRGATTNQLRVNARRIALRATLVALIGGVLICAMADVIAAHRVTHAEDAAIGARVATLMSEYSPSLEHFVTANRDETPGVDPPDFDASTFLEWFVPSGNHPLALNDGTPALPEADDHVMALRTRSINGHPYLVEGEQTTLGRLIVGESTADDDDVVSTLLVIQSILAPLALLALYLVAVTIGQRAAAPVDRARRRQLEFAADASHELRTPLSVIQAEVTLALSASRPAEQYRDALERVSAESRRLRKIVDDLLWLARLDSIPQGQQHELVDVAIIADSCVDRFITLAASHDVTLSRTDEGGLDPLIFAPVDWVDELFSVLLDNATRYAGTGGQVVVGVVSDEQRVSVAVDDDGPGFGDGDHEELLERFHRANSERGGAGLGLAIAGAVAAATSADIMLSASPYGGARVMISWPRSRVEGENAPRGVDL
jgi:signal transduction histidine kinase